MAFRLSYIDPAKTDIAEAKKWYHDQLPGLEKRFGNDLTICLNRLTANPYTHAIRYDKLRIAHTDIFPYSIHFHIDERNKRVIVVGIIHDSRDPAILKKRQ